MVVGVLAGSLALGEAKPRVVLSGPAAAEATIARMRRELELLGFEVVVAPVPEEKEAGLAVLTRQHDAVAAARVGSEPGTITLWIDPERAPATAAAPPEIAIEAGTAGAEDAGVVVLRAIEVLRARLLPRGPEAAANAGAPPSTGSGANATPPTIPRSGTVAAPPNTAERPRPRAAPGRVSFFAGPALLASPGGLPPALDVLVGARWSPLPRIDVELLGYAPTAAATVSAAEGLIELRVASLGAGVSATLTDPASPFFATAGLGAGGALLFFAGEAAGAGTGDEGARVSAMPHAHLAAGYWLGRHFGLRADVTVAAIRPRPVLRIAGREVAALDAPAVFVSLGAEARP